MVVVVVFLLPSSLSNVVSKLGLVSSQYLRSVKVLYVLIVPSRRNDVMIPASVTSSVRTHFQHGLFLTGVILFNEDDRWMDYIRYSTDK